MNTVYVIDAVRTPIGKYGGTLATVRPDDLLAHVIKSLVARNPNVDVNAIEDVIAGDATNGLIKALNLSMLRDNRSYFPPYYAVPIVRSAVLLARPELREALNTLAGRISEDDMRAMNAAVDVEHRDVAATVSDFLNARLRN